MQRTKLTLEVDTDFEHEEIAQHGVNQIQAAIGYTSSLMDLLRMARELDSIQRPRDQEAFNEGLLTVCQIVKGLQDVINRNVDNLAGDSRV